MFIVTIIGKDRLFDIYHIKDKVVLWIKEKNGHTKRVEHPWSPSIYDIPDTETQTQTRHPIEKQSNTSI